MCTLVVGIGLLASTVAPGPGAASTDQADPPDPRRVEELATATSDTYLQADGSYEFVGYTSPVNYLSDAGDWEPIDNELVPSSGATYAVENAENDYTVKIPEDAGSDPVKITTDAHWVTFEMDGLDGHPVVDGTEATFTQAEGADATEVVYEARPDGVKESIVLDQAPADAVEYGFDLALSAGLTPRLRTTGEIDIVDTTGQQVFTMPAPFMTDADNAISTNVAYQLSQIATGWRLVVTPSDGWLQDPDRAYPVIVDPTVTTNPSTDGWIAEANPTQVNAGGAYLRAGGTVGSRRRALVKFDVANVPADAVLDTATPPALKLFLDSSLSVGGGTSSLVARRVADNQPWTPGWLSWKNRQNQTPWATPGGTWGEASPPVTVSLGTSGYKNFTVTETVRKWINGSQANNGFIVMQNTDVDKALWFHSVNTTTSNKPTLTIKYSVPDHPPAQPTGLTISPGGSSYTTSTSPTLSATVADPDGGSLTASFSVTASDGSDVWAGTSPTTASGGTASVQVPFGTLIPGQTYTVTATAHAGTPTLNSPPATMTFQDDSLAPETTTSTCTSPCTPFSPSPVLFNGALTGTSTISLTPALPVADITDVGYVYYKLKIVSGSVPASVSAYSTDQPVPIKPTATTTSTATQQTVYFKLFPSQDNNVALRVNYGAPVTVTLTALGWQTWDTELPPAPDEEEFDVYEPSAAEVAEYDADVSSYGQDSVEMMAGIPQEQSCAQQTIEGEPGPVSFCTTDYNSIAAYEAAIASDPDVDASFKTTAAAAERASFSNCPVARWEINRKEMCGVSIRTGVWTEGIRIKGTATVYTEWTITLSGWDKKISLQTRTHLDPATTSGWGNDLSVLSTVWGEGEYGSEQLFDVLRNRPGERTESSSGSVNQDDLVTNEVRIEHLSLNTGLYAAGHEYVPDVDPPNPPTAGTSPDIRCDRKDYLSRGRGAGCVVKAAIATAYISADRYPNSSQLIKSAQNGISDGYGKPGDKTLKRLTSRPAMKQNRRAAQRRCKTLGVELSCDEYPFAASYQGCARPLSDPQIDPGRWCKVKSVPGSENSAVGGKVGTMLHSGRVFDGEGYYVDVVDD